MIRTPRSLNLCVLAFYFHIIPATRESRVNPLITDTMCQDGVEVIARSTLSAAPTLSDVYQGDDVEASSRQTGEVSIFRGNILTMAGGKFSPCEAFAIKDDTIIASGRLPEVQAAVGTETAISDYSDKTILPGFVDPHIHLLLTALVSNPSHIVDFSYPNVKTEQEALSLIKRSVAQKPGGEWISGYGYDPSLVTDHPDLTLQMIDDVSGRYHPVYIINQSGHVAYLNTAAFEAAGIGLRPGQPGFPADDANFQKDDQGNLDGIILEEAVTQLAKFLPKLEPPQVVAGARHVLQSWASRGITTVFDCGIGHLDGLPDLARIRQVTQMPDLPRFRGAIAIQAIEHLLPMLDVLAPPPWNLGNIKIYGIKLWLDGSTQGRTAALHKPYMEPDGSLGKNYGILNYRKGHSLDSPPDDDRLVEIMTPLVQKGWQIILHTNGSRAFDQALRVYSRVLATSSSSVSGLRHMHRLEHVTADITPDQLARAAQLGLGISHLIAHVRKWGSAFSDWVLGQDRASRIDPVADSAASGATFSFHSDSPISQADPLQYVDTAVSRVMVETGTPLGQEQSISLEHAFAGITFNPARQLGALDEIGSLEVGKRADFVVLDKDPRDFEGNIKAHVKILETWIGGRLVSQADSGA